MFYFVHLQRSYIYIYRGYFTQGRLLRPKYDRAEFAEASHKLINFISIRADKIKTTDFRQASKIYKFGANEAAKQKV